MSAPDEIAPFPPTDGNADALLRECTADAQAFNTVFGLPDIVERLDTQFAFTMSARADRLFRLRDGSLWHVEWQSSRDPDMFRRMLEYWVFVRNKVDAAARIRSDVILVGKAPRAWVIEDWVGDRKVRIPVTEFRTVDVTSLFERGNASDMLIGILGKGGVRADNLIRIVATVVGQSPDRRDRLLSMLGRMIELRGDPVSLPPGVHEMIEALNIDYERNPVFRRPFEMGERAERRRSALTLLNIARPSAKAENERITAALPDATIDALVAAASDYLAGPSEEARQRLDELLAARG